MKSSILASLAALATLLSSALASPLSDLVEKHGLSWMVGKWETAGGEASLAYEWRVEKNVLAVAFSAGERESEGMIALKPGSTEAKYMAVDSKGSVSHGGWSEHNGNPLLKTTTMTAEGESRTMAVEHIKVDADTMKVVVYKTDSSGTIGDQLMEAEFIRKK
jgi:hypothetical protein